MKIRSVIVQRVSVDVMDDLASASLRHLPVFPFPPIASCAITQPFRSVRNRVRSACPFNGRRDGWRGTHRSRGWGDHLVAAPHMFARRQAGNFLLVGMQRVAVAMPHLVMPHAHLTRNDGAVAMKTRAADDPVTPAVFGASVLLRPFVVHQAEPVRCVLSPTAVNRTNSHRCLALNVANYYRPYKAIGKVVHRIGQRIAAVEKLTEPT